MKENKNHRIAKKIGTDTLAMHPIISCSGIFLVCVVARIFEYFYIRTDETILAENFLHKLWGIVLLFIVLSVSNMPWKEIGFTRNGSLGNFIKGILLSILSFTIAYSLECLILYLANHDVQPAFYASGFSLSGESERQTGILFILMCIAFNIINVWMEEGIFRGLFTKLLVKRSSTKSMLFIAFLFGIWHLVMPLRDYAEGRTTIGNFLIMGIGYIILAGIMSIKWSMLYQLTNSLWMGLGDHLFNNVIATNLVHVISCGKADSLQIVRILIGQLLSFALVIVFCRSKRVRDRAKV